LFPYGFSHRIAIDRADTRPQKLSAKLTAALSGIPREPKQVAIAARDLDLEQGLRPELSHRLEQWDSESLARTVCATSSLSRSRSRRGWKR
jgi:hypothetical protein